MNLFGTFGQLFAIALALLLAPLLTGWVNQCRAWLQNRSAPPLLQPYYMLHKLFLKDVVLAHGASHLFRFAPFVVFGCMVLACAIIPTLSTDLAGAGRRHHRPGRHLRPGAHFHLAGGDGHRHRLRQPRRAARNARRLPRRAGPADGDLHHRHDLPVHLGGHHRRDPGPPRVRHLSEPGLRRHRLLLAAVRRLREHPALVTRLHENTRYFREQLLARGFRPLPGDTPIIPVILGETAKAIRMSEMLLDEGVFVTGFGYPVVPQGEARVRCQVSAAHTRDDLDEALRAFETVGQRLGLI